MYCVKADIEKHLKQDVLVDLTDDTGAGTVNESVVTACIVAADALIDGYLRGRYTVPLSTVPALVKEVSVNLAIYELYNRTKALLVTEQIEKNRTFYIDLLGNIAKGTVTLDVVDQSGLAVTTSFAASSKTASDRVFTPDLLGAY